jgi:hypothetical protein
MSTGIGAWRLLARASLFSLLLSVLPHSQAQDDPPTQTVTIIGSRSGHTSPPPPIPDIGFVPPGVPAAMGYEGTPTGTYAPTPAGTGLPAPTPSCSSGGVPSVQPMSGHPVVLSNRTRRRRQSCSGSDIARAAGAGCSPAAVGLQPHAWHGG